MSYLFYSENVYQVWGQCQAFKTIAASHSSLDIARGYREEALEVVLAALPFLRDTPKNFEGRERRYAGIYHLFKKYYNLA